MTPEELAEIERCIYPHGLGLCARDSHRLVAEVRSQAARITELEAEMDGAAEWRRTWKARAKRAEAALADTYAAVQDALTQSADEDEMREALTVILTGTPRGRESTVEIGGQVMTQAQFDAARYPLLHPNPGPVAPRG